MTPSPADDGDLRCVCPHCDGHVSFPPALAGSGAACPHCGTEIDLVASDTREPPGEGDACSDQPARLTASDLARAFRGRVERRRPSGSYQVGVVAVAAAMLALPLVYAAVVAFVGWGLARFALGWFAWAHRFTGGSHLMGVKSLIFVVGLFLGVFVLVFLVRPLFAREQRRAQPLALNAAAEPLLFAFVHMICDAVGAPRPTRIDVDCRLNASAGFRRGLRSVAGGDLVLTLGLPLVAGLNANQLAGVLAHELGHFSQGVGMRACYVVRMLNARLEHIVRGGAAWAEGIEEWSMESNSGAAMILVGLGRIGVGLSHAVLRIVGLAGQAVSAHLLRHMEFDADRVQIEFAGSAGFESTLARFLVLQDTSRSLYRELRTAWNLSRRLPDNLPVALVDASAVLPPGKRERLVAKQLAREREFLDTHPTDAARILRAQQLAAPGLFRLDLPAPLLFADFDVLARQVTILHYEDDLGLPRDLIRLVPSQAKADSPE